MSTLMIEKKTHTRKRIQHSTKRKDKLSGDKEKHRKKNTHGEKKRQIKKKEKKNTHDYLFYFLKDLR